jgi:capsular exopolysaccharide synthesis family protein
MATVPDLDLRKFMLVIRQWLWLLGLAVLLASMLSYTASINLPKSYQASATFVVGDDTANLRPNIDDVSVSQRLANVYADMVTREPTLTATINTLNLPMNWWDLQRQVVVAHADGSQIVTIRVTDTDPTRTKAIVDELTHQLILQSPTQQNEDDLQQRRDFVSQQLQTLQANIQSAEASLADKQDKLSKESSARGVLDLQDQIKAIQLNLTNWRASYASLLSTNLSKSPNTLTVIQPAFIPTAPVGPNVHMNVLAGAALGLLIALGAIFLIEYLRGERLSDPEDISRVLDLAVLGSVGRMPRVSNSTHRLVAANAPESSYAEDYRRLRTNLQFTWSSTTDDSEPIVVYVTSPGPEEGKTVTSTNLAVTFARTGKRTIIVDADLMHPSVHNLVGVPSGPGLFELLWGGLGPSTELAPAQVESLLLPTGVPGLRCLPAGATADQAGGELMPLDEMQQLLRTLRGMAEVVVVDGPPILAVADAPALAAMELGVVVVIESGETRVDAARLAQQALERANARVLGVVLNKTRPRRSYYYSYYQRRDDVRVSATERMRRMRASRKRAKA